MTACGAQAIKIERHDTLRHEHHTRTGTRPVEVYREHANGLYVARPFIAHPRIRAWQAHLLPQLGVQLCRYDFHGEREHDYYLDIASITREGPVWSVRDHYLDLIVWDGLSAEIVDTDELLAAHAAGLISTPEMHAAVEGAHRVLHGLAQSRYSVADWLAAQGLQLFWHEDLVLI